MKKYHVNKNAQGNGDHEVHAEDCIYLPKVDSRTYLGEFSSCIGAVTKAKNIYTTTNGCKTCSNLCHTT